MEFLSDKMGNTMEKENSRGKMGISILPWYMLVKKSSRQPDKWLNKIAKKIEHGKENRRGQVWKEREEGKDQRLGYLNVKRSGRWGRISKGAKKGSQWGDRQENVVPETKLVKKKTKN